MNKFIKLIETNDTASWVLTYTTMGAIIYIGMKAMQLI
jgi:hypothetical protein